MRWYLSQNGATSGPFEEYQLRALYEGSHVSQFSAMVRPENGDQWIYLKNAEFITRRTRNIALIMGAAAAILFLFVSGCLTLIAIGSR
jgi:hypothetical protein